MCHLRGCVCTKLSGKVLVMIFNQVIVNSCEGDRKYDGKTTNSRLLVYERSCPGALTTALFWIDWNKNVDVE